MALQQSEITVDLRFANVELIIYDSHKTKT
jgi:hypothetical protein